ncbi:peptidylprolyl isomerase SurA [Aliidiomarina celeris]|uniref:peptidylprolyl isomerase SurA n=1 Tax=Aliidiomarina celeris TaxID=2249428 RepID=UPI000DEA5560|nr:peptidylprolyl isomerase SurA [Aliidiomarina celeris]
MKLLNLCITSLCVAVLAFSVNAEPLDRIAIVVDEDIVLESEIEDLIRQVKMNLESDGRSIPSDEALRVQASERLINESLQLQMARRMGFAISDSQLDQAISSIAADNNLPIDAFRNQIELRGQSWADYRENIRRQIVVSEVQRMSIQRRIYMSPQEIDMLVQIIQEQGGTQTEYELGQILVRVQNENGDLDMNASLEQAEQVMERLNQGDSFRDLAVSVSSASNALEGGDMGWLTSNSMPTLFAAAVEENNSKGATLGPLRSGIGYHILRIHDIRGAEQAEIEEVRARHILVQPSVILSDNRAQQMLRDFKQRIETGEATFAELAGEHSADPGSARNGGDLGFAVPDVYVPEFRDRVARQDVGRISEPFRTEHGWHIVEVLERRVQDVTEQRTRDRARQLLYSRKYQEELNIWQQEVRDEAYVEFKTQ